MIRKYEITGISEISLLMRIFAENGDSEEIPCQGNELCYQIKGKSYFYKEGKKIGELEEGCAYRIVIDGRIVVEKKRNT